jgi:hypothetical protein
MCDVNIIKVPINANEKQESKDIIEKEDQLHAKVKASPSIMGGTM